MTTNKQKKQIGTDIINFFIQSNENVIPELISDGYHTFEELYDFRFYLNALLFNGWANKGLYDVHKSWKHSNGELCFGGDWFIVVAELPTGQISFHYREKVWKYFNLNEKEIPNEWDEHTSFDVILRLSDYLQMSVYESKYNEMLKESLDFSEALKKLKEGECVKNKYWNGENMYVCMQYPDENSKMTMPYLYLKTPCGELVPYQPSQYDLLSKYWEVVE